MKQEWHLPPATGPAPVVDALATATGLSKQRLKQVMRKGALWLQRDGSVRRLRRASTVLQPGDILHLYYDEQVLARQAPVARLIADEGDYSAWDKPPGMYSQGTKWGDHCSIARWVEQHLQPERPAFLVHRLDRAASGLILIAHRKRVAAALARMFRERRMEKHYRAGVRGHFPDTPEALVIEAPINGRPARSLVRLLGYDQDADQSLLEVEIETGRKHQIRRHLAGQGYPIIGDRLYGSPEVGTDLRLRAQSLAFRCPVTGAQRSYALGEGCSQSDSSTAVSRDP